MAKLAIIIGVSNYTHQPTLPACENDAEIVRYALDSTKNYEEILVLQGATTTSSNAKHELTQFISKYKTRSDIDEIFFYYSGHGQAINDEFYYIFTDYDEAHRNRTSLTNSELDGYLRSLNANITIKVVDACNAGIRYVKDLNDLTEILQKGVNDQGFNKIYFLFSSLSDQSSYASSTISTYTHSFIESICHSDIQNIRYRDIIDQISDKFLNTPTQKPYFVIQADNTEIFGSFSSDLKKKIEERLESMLANNPDKTVEELIPVKAPTLSQLVRDHAKQYLSDKEIIETIERLPSLFAEYALPSEISDLFEISCLVAKDFDGLEDLRSIGLWLKENRNDYFAQLRVGTEEYEAYENEAAKFLTIIGNMEGTKKVKKTRNVIIGYQPKWSQISFWRIELILKTSLPNIPTYKLNVLYLFSKLDIRIFYSFDESWPGLGEMESRTAHGEWRAIHMKLIQLKDNNKILLPIFEELSKYVTESLEKIIGASRDQNNENPQT
jgi:uncharacterized caspase-like protein